MSRMCLLPSPFTGASYCLINRLIDVNFEALCYSHYPLLLRRVMHLNERSLIFNEEMVGGRERVTTDEERVLREG